MKAIEILASAHDERDSNYDQLLRVLHDVATGRVGWQCVEVDLQARTWQLTHPQALPALRPPAQMLAGGLDWRTEEAALAAEFRESQQRARERILAGGRTNGDLNDGPRPSDPDAGLTIDDLRRFADKAERDHLS